MTSPSSEATSSVASKPREDQKENVVFIYVYEDNYLQQITEGIPTKDLKFTSYARFHLHHTLQVMSCKAKDAHDITELIFKWLTDARRLYEKMKLQEGHEDEENFEKSSGYELNPSNSSSDSETEKYRQKRKRSLKKKKTAKGWSDFKFGVSSEAIKNYKQETEEINNLIKFEIAKSLKENERLKMPQIHLQTRISTTNATAAAVANPNDSIVSLSRTQYIEIVKIALAIFDYKKPHRIEDFKIACELQEKKRPLIVLFGGTSGCGKSTLASLTASRLGITKVLSTDSIRHMLRSYITKKENPVLYASTYHAGESLNQEDPAVKAMTTEERVLEGYREQCKLVLELLEGIIEKCERCNESLLVEGVHLQTDAVVALMKKFKSVIPYTVYISNESKHKERFAIRAKYMTLEPNNNKYIKYFENITLISHYLCERSDVYNIPKIDNTNIDRSLATIHYSVFKCLKKIVRQEEKVAKHPELQLSYSGSCLYDPINNKCKIPFFSDLPQWTSKRVLKIIRRSLEKQAAERALQESANTEDVPATVNPTAPSTALLRNLAPELLSIEDIESPVQKKIAQIAIIEESLPSPQATLSDASVSLTPSESERNPLSPPLGGLARRTISIENISATSCSDTDDEIIRSYNTGKQTEERDPLKLEHLKFAGEYSEADASLTEGSVFGS